MWSDVQESEPSTSCLDLPENGWGLCQSEAAAADRRGYSPRFLCEEHLINQYGDLRAGGGGAGLTGPRAI
jgi:hypothetical protein